MESVTKQRLIGAVVLIALAVIFLPMLIKGPAPDSGVSDVSTKVPDAPEGQFVEIPLNTVGEVPAGGAVGLKPGAPAASEAIPLGAEAAAPASGALPETTAAGDYAVNFGAYATPADAAQMVAMLKKAQLPGFSESTTINGKPAYRVRIGPYADRAQAEIVRLEAVKVRSDVNAQVVALDAATPVAAPTPAAAPASASTAQAAPNSTVTTQALPPEPAKPAAPKPEPAKPVATTTPKPAAPPIAAPKPTTADTKPTASAPTATGYAVQVGAFANAASATALRDKLRASGFSAFIEQVKTDSGTQNRVRVGPVATRAAADQLKSQVAAKAGVSGQVRPHP